MLLNLNVGILGHVDSGKTTLCKALSEISSTAAFDKNPQSKERGITLDLGFSAYSCSLPNHLKTNLTAQFQYDRLQFTFVDCPGHAKLIRTIIGGAQIIDLMILVIDATKGIQTQTAECLVIGELTCKRMIVAVNKIDQLEPTVKTKTIEKLSKRLRNALTGTCFNETNTPIVPVSALTEENLPEFVTILEANAFFPLRNDHEPFLFAVDHCFSIRGQGTVCTGTVLQGCVSVNDAIEIPALKLIKKVKSIQMFRKSMPKAVQGDRIGICITQFDPNLLERGIIAKSNYVRTVKAAIIRLNPIKYYKGTIASKCKFHISLGHETVMATITLFIANNVQQNAFDWSLDYEFLPEISKSESMDSASLQSNIFALLEFDHAVPVQPNALVIGSKFDIELTSNQCRLAFWSHLDPTAICGVNNFPEFLGQLKVFKRKSKCGHVQRVVNASEIIVDQLFAKESTNRQMFVGMCVELKPLSDPDVCGIIESTFGSTTKVKVRLNAELTAIDVNTLKQKNNNVEVLLNFRKYLYRPGNQKIVQ